MATASAASAPPRAGEDARRTRGHLDDGLEAFRDQKKENRNHADRPVRLRGLDRQDSGQEHDDEPDEPRRAGPAKAPPERTAQAEGEEDSLDRRQEGSIRNVVARVAVAVEVEHQKVRSDVQEQSVGHLQPVSGVPDRDRSGALEEDLRVLEGEDREREEKDNGGHNRQGEAGDDLPGLRGERPDAETERERHDARREHRREKIERVIRLESDGDSRPEENPVKSPSGLERLHEGEKREELHQRADDAVEADSREVQVPAASQEKNGGRRGGLPSEETARQQVEHRDRRGAAKRGHATDARDGLSESGDRRGHGIEIEGRHLARVGHEDRPMSLQNRLRNQDVLQFVEEAAGRKAFEGGEPEGGRAQKRKDQEDLFPRQERASHRGLSIRPLMNQEGATGRENRSGEKERDSLFGQLLRQPRLPGGEDPQAGHGENGAEYPTREGKLRHDDHFRKTAYNSIVPPRRRRTSNEYKAKLRGTMKRSAGKRRRDQIGYTRRG